MRLSRIFIDLEIREGTTLELPNDKAHYLQRVLRVKPGQRFVLFNGLDDFDYHAELNIEGKHVTAQVLERVQKAADPSIEITVLQAAGKADHMDFVVQKATELGATSLIFFNSERTQSPFHQARLDKKLTHWRGIAASACEQCNRNRIPDIDFFADLQTMLNSLPSANRLVLDFNGEAFDRVSTKLDVTLPFQLLVGAEGGFTDAELALAQDFEFKSCRLGKRVLRMETAALAIVTLVQHYFGDLN